MNSHKGTPGGDDEHSSADPTHDPTRGLADRRADVTRGAIRDAAMEALESAHPSALSIPDVARRAGVSVRTVYRYFPNKAALVEAVSQWHLERASGDDYDEAARRVVQDTETFLPILWESFAQNIESVRVQHLSPAGNEVRRARSDRLRSLVRVEVERWAPGLSPVDLERAVDLVTLLTSSSAFLEFTDRFDRNPTEAAHLAWWAVSTLLDRLADDRAITKPKPRHP